MRVMARRVTTRGGVTLVELLIATAVASMLGLIACAVLLHLRRAADSFAQRDAGDRLGTEGIAVLEALGRRLRYPQLVGDTALQAEMRLAIGVVCQGSVSSLTLAPAQVGSLDALTSLGDLPLPGDRLEVRTTETTGPDGSGWERLEITQVEMPLARAGCDPASPYVSPAQQGLPVLRLAFPAREQTWGSGAPVELFRSVRLLSYQAGAQGWSVGMRRCVGDVCSAVQPIVGPVRSPREGGLRFSQGAADDAVTVRLRVPMIDRTFEGVLSAIGTSR